MQPRSFEERVTMLERQMQDLRELPERMSGLESQILQLRQGTANEFSAIRDDMKADTSETRLFMRVLYEDVLSRLQALGEADDSQ